MILFIILYLCIWAQDTLFSIWLISFVTPCKSLQEIVDVVFFFFFTKRRQLLCTLIPSHAFLQRFHFVYCLDLIPDRQIIQNKYSMKREQENKKGGRERYRKEYKGKGEIDRGNEIRWENSPQQKLCTKRAQCMHEVFSKVQIGNESRFFWNMSKTKTWLFFSASV